MIKPIPLVILSGYSPKESYEKAGKAEGANLYSENKGLIKLPNGKYQLENLVDMIHKVPDGLVKDVTVMGPKSEFKNLNLTDVSYIDNNTGFEKKFEKLKEHYTGPLGIITNDLFALTTEDITAHLTEALPYLDTHSFLLQLVNKDSLGKGSEYKPKYGLRNRKWKFEPIYPGHLQIVKIDEVPDFVGPGLDFMYEEMRGHSQDGKAELIYNKLKEEELLTHVLYKYGTSAIRFKFKMLTYRKLEKKFSKLLGMPTKIITSDRASFARDADALPEIDDMLSTLEKES